MKRRRVTEGQKRMCVESLFSNASERMKDDKFVKSLMVHYHKNGFLTDFQLGAFERLCVRIGVPEWIFAKAFPFLKITEERIRYDENISKYIVILNSFEKMPTVNNEWLFKIEEITGIGDYYLRRSLKYSIHVNKWKYFKNNYEPKSSSDIDLSDE